MRACVHAHSVYLQAWQKCKLNPFVQLLKCFFVHGNSRPSSFLTKWCNLLSNFCGFCILWMVQNFPSFFKIVLHDNIIFSFQAIVEIWSSSCIRALIILSCSLSRYCRINERVGDLEKVHEDVSTCSLSTRRQVWNQDSYRRCTSAVLGKVPVEPLPPFL